MKKLCSILLITALCVSLVACGSKNKEKRQVNSIVTTMGNNASFPSAVNVFSTTDLEGNIVTNDIFSQADLTVVNFWGTFCNPCIDEMPELAKWAEEMPDNVQMLGAIVDVETVDSDEYALAQQIVEKTGVTYENVIAPGAFDQFINKLAGVPTTVFIDKNGKTGSIPFSGKSIPPDKVSSQYANKPSNKAFMKMLILFSVICLFLSL